MFIVDVSAKVNSLCLLHRIEQDGSSRVLGSGFFFMDKDVVATAKHIMEEVENARSPFFLRIQPVGSNQLFKAVECCYHAEQDLAFVKLDRPHDDAPPLIPGFSTEAGFMYVAYNPRAGRPLVKFVPSFRTPPPRETDNSITHFFEWDSPTDPGNSGGPVIATDGGVVAILSGVASEVEVADCAGRSDGATMYRARAVWIDPLMRTYLRWKHNPESLLRDQAPFVHR